ncbi:primosomal protein N' (replication factor Y) [Okibacterium sp. HSC-33S16]|uniref:primosomal protein N' family DNA-binding protein n=1 Tax=Okibacterium sp. HSC-33S16 TaxID=2910965 RepID=UPI00209E8901|nr:primosomal protein N' [Okibacterium sp. HSC-33S16]MCP2030855.1 primosomal protein N' (replication factor Y) [Okibacterium sp. HSC-33S16]
MTTPAETTPVDAAPARVARVALDSPLPQLDHLFDYSIPPELADTAIPGVRVMVPFRSAGRLNRGYIVEVAEKADGFEGALSPIDSVVSPVPVLTPELWSLARRLADRAAGSATDILRLAIPPRQVRVEKAWLAEQDALRSGAPEARDDTQDAEEAEADDTDDTAVAPTSDAMTATLPGVSDYPVALTDAVDAGGRVALAAIPTVADIGGAWVGRWAVTIAELSERVLASGSSVIVALPDYRDQDQLQAALERRVPLEQLTRVDARQSNAERYRSFLDCLTDAPRIILGNRSAVYAPAAKLGLLVVWDDGDPLHSEPLSPYVHARDAALVRQEESGAALVFAGHSRSADVQRLVEMGWLTPVEPTRLYTPRVMLTAQSDVVEPGAVAARIPSLAWRQAREALEKGPVLVQVARPGYAPVIACARCTQAARCTVCSGPLGIPRAGALPACTLCGAIAGNWSCDNCEGTKLRLVTRGTGRTAEELGRAFPGVKVVVSDGERQVIGVSGSPALVIATRGAEPVADGGYAAVLLLDGDRMLAAESLRIAEDCLRWWSNAAALSAPGAPVVLTGVSGTLATALATWNQPAFASAELADRRTLRFPPAVRVASVTGDDAAVSEAVAAVTSLVPADVLGPVPTENGVRTILRLDYGKAQAAARELRATVVKNATKRRKPPAGKAAYRQAPTLKVRFDDPEILS